MEKMKSNFVSHAEHELELILRKECKNEDGSIDVEGMEMQKVMNNQILDMIKLFSTQGHSGFTAQYSISILTKLLNGEPLSPLTGEDDEWFDPCDGYPYFQNKRYGKVFKDKETGKCHVIDGYIFSEDGGQSWFTNKNSNLEIKEFPFKIQKSIYLLIDKEGNLTEYKK